MGFRACPRRGDPFERRVRETYGANVVGAPRAGIEPLTTVARQDDRVEARGHLRFILEGDGPNLPSVVSTPAASMSGTRSSEVKASVGLDLSASFLGALGLPVPGAELTATLWEGATGFAFEVRGVTENQVDLAELGRAVDGRRIADNPATSIFLTDRSQQLLLITRTLTASTFAIHATRAGGEDVQVAVDGLTDLVGSAQVSISWKREKGNWVSFHGSTAVTFGFSVVPCDIAPGTRKLQFGVARADLTFGAGPARKPTVARPAIDDRSRSGLLVFDEPCRAGR